PPQCLNLAVRRPLADAEDDELGGLDHRDADQTDQPAVVEVVLSHSRAVTSHEESFFGLRPHERAVAPLVETEVRDRLTDVGPKRLAVVLEGRPLRPLVNRMLQEGEVAAYVEILPFGVGADRARAPESQPAPLEEPEAVNAFWVEYVLLRFV